MKRILLYCLALISLAADLNAQTSEGGLPKSFTIDQLKASLSLPGYNLQSIDKSLLLAEDELFPTPYRYGLFEDVSINIKTSGKSDALSGDIGNIWRYRIAADSAKSIQIIFSKFNIPVGAQLFLYNDSHDLISGAFTNKNRLKDSTFVIADFKGNHLVVEYFEPKNSEFSGELIIGAISQAYKDIFSEESTTSEYININCNEGKNLQLQKHAVCMITFKSGVASYSCSGALINNTKQDGTPYFLTANHCISTESEASSTIAYFNYEYDGCDVSDETKVSSYITVNGDSLITTASYSDYSILLLKNKPPAESQPYYAGWNANDSAAYTAVGIHHPEGYAKKLSLELDTISSYDEILMWDEGSNSPASSHWEINNDVGITASGSSGSPLFNARKQIIGQLHGGDDTYDYYGKISYSWLHRSGTYPTLKSILDPDNTGTLSLGGYSPSDNPPDVYFTTSLSQVCLDVPVQFTDYSAFELDPFTRTWIITPSTGYSFMDGTSDESANPVIAFTTKDTYTIQLSITNSGGTDSEEKSISAGDVITVDVSTLFVDNACLCDFTKMELLASGATDYAWSIDDEDLDKIVLNKYIGDTVTVALVEGFESDSSVILDLSIVGNQGTCVDTANFSYELIRPGNDEIENAYQVSYAQTYSFSNECATIEDTEPVPPFTSCTSQDSWCDEYETGDNIVENSVWFKFIAGQSGAVSIASVNLDNEIALYEADSYAAILNGDYTLLAANDDRSTTNYYPKINSANVTPDVTYWIQVDGSAGGVEGDFTLKLTSVTPTGISTEQSDILIVYPQPAADYVYIQGDVLGYNSLQINVFSATGNLVHSETVTYDEAGIRLNISAWPTGIYVVKIQSGSNLYITKIIKY